MGRKPEFIEQPINLSGDVQVIVRAPKNKMPHISWEGGTVTVSVDASPSRPARPVLSAEIRDLVEEPQTNGPTHDTPALRQLKEDLQKRHPKGASRPYTSADAFRAAGINVNPDEMTNVFEAAAAEPPPVFTSADLGGDN